MNGLEERITKVEGILEEVRSRHNHVEDRLGIIETRRDAKADKMGNSYLVSHHRDFNVSLSIFSLEGGKKWQ